MEIVDLRNTVACCNDELIEIGDALIYYAEEKMEEGHPSLFLLGYNRVTNRERILANWMLPGPAYVQHCFSFPEDIVVAMESGESRARVLRLDKRTGAQRSLASLSFIGDFQSCVALDEEHLLFFAGPNGRQAALFQKYKKLTGFSRVAYLYDLEEGRYYYVRDPRVCRADASRFVPYRRGGTAQLLVLEPRGSVRDKWDCYRNRRWLGDHVDDNVWDCPLHDFIVSVKNGEARAPLELVFSAGTDGMVRYAGQDAENLYFRAQYFPTGDQRVCAYGKEGGRHFVAAKLTSGRGGGRFVIDREGGRAYRVCETADEYEVEGVMNSAVRAGYPKELGKFVTCVEDRFFVAQYILADEHDSFEFNSVYDVETGTQKSYEGRCAVSGGTVVLY